MKQIGFFLACGCAVQHGERSSLSRPPKTGGNLEHKYRGGIYRPANEVLSDKGLAWPFVGESVTENKTVENMNRIFKAAKENGYEVFISPHYFFPMTVDGNSTALSRPKRLRTRCSLAAEN
jgi:hypothetical protein